MFCILVSACFTTVVLFVIPDSYDTKLFKALINFISFLFEFRFYNDDPSVIYQLQTEVSGSPPVENAHLQSSEHIYR